MFDLPDPRDPGEQREQREPRSPTGPRGPSDQRTPFQVPPRPQLRPSVLERARTWIDWVGPGRLVATAAVVLAVLAAAYWLVRPPAATTESTLPFARSASTTTSAVGADTAGPQLAATAGSTTPSTAGELVVHVAGAVTSSGVYRLAPGSRVVDAVQAAGGLAGDALPDAVNLAALLTDGERVYVPRVGESIPPLVSVSSASSTAPGPVNLNTATADDLDSLPGIGPATAAAIIDHRDQHGPFVTVDDLADVRGIGPAKVEALRGLVTT